MQKRSVFCFGDVNFEVHIKKYCQHFKRTKKCPNVFFLFFCYTCYLVSEHTVFCFAVGHLKLQGLFMIIVFDYSENNNNYFKASVDLCDFLEAANTFI